MVLYGIQMHLLFFACEAIEIKGEKEGGNTVEKLKKKEKP